MFSLVRKPAAKRELLDNRNLLSVGDHGKLEVDDDDVDWDEVDFENMISVRRMVMMKGLGMDIVVVRWWFVMVRLGV